MPLRLITATIIAMIATVCIVWRHRVGVAHVHPTSFAAPSIVSVVSFIGIPIVYDCQDAEFPKWFITYGSVQAWLSVSPQIDDILEEHGIPSYKISRIEIANPEYTTEYRPETSRGCLSTKRVEFIFVGYLYEFKGILLLLDAFENIVHTTSAELHIVGSGPLQSKIEKRINNDEHLTKSVHLWGEVSHRQALFLISESDVLINPSKKETGPRTVLEALEVGTPVISTKVGIVQNKVSHLENGLLIDRTRQDIQDAIKYIAENSSVRAEMTRSVLSEGGSSDIKETYEQIARVYRHLGETRRSK